MTDCKSPNSQSNPLVKCHNPNDKQPADSKHAMSIIVVILGSFRIPATSTLASLLLGVHCPFYSALLPSSWARCTRLGRSRLNTRVGLVLVTVCSVQWRPWRFLPELHCIQRLAPTAQWLPRRLPIEGACRLRRPEGALDLHQGRSS